MYRCRTGLVILLLLFFYFIISISHAYNYEVNLFAICTSGGIQKGVQMISDNTGGTILIWLDSRDKRKEKDRLYYDIYAQRVNSQGSTYWQDGGICVAISVAHEGSSPYFIGVYPKVISDGKHGAIISWADSGKIFAQRIDGDGNILWDKGGLIVCATSNWRHYPEIITDNNEGAIIAWLDYREGVGIYRGLHSNIYSQKINSQGSTLWQFNGIPISQEKFNQTFHSMIKDGEGGAIFSWLDGRNGGSNSPQVVLQRINSQGDILWAKNGIAISTTLSTKSKPILRMDKSGDVIVIWSERYPNKGTYLLMQKINQFGDILLSPGGIELFHYNKSIAFEFSDIQITDYPADEFILLWRDFWDNSTSVLSALKIHQSGNIIWSKVDEPIYISYGLLAGPKIVSDNKGGAFITAQESRVGKRGTNIIFLHINSESEIITGIDDLVDSTILLFQYDPQIIYDGQENVFIGWHGGSWDYDIYLNIIKIN